MKISKEKVVSLSYTLREKNSDGVIVESVDKHSPLVFMYGVGNMLQAFEKNLEGLEEGDPFNFLLQAREAYGEYSKEAVVGLPMHIFELNGVVDQSLLKIGREIPMSDGEGNRLNGIVTAVTDQLITMDFNHPMAGKTLHFSGEIMDIREATAEEKDYGHIHGPEKCDDCGCDLGH
jgi:FKBP-type peptidyl-prolyl cis-trans isomerase SlyD